MKNKSVMRDMLLIYNNSAYDWMGYKYSDYNYISYHHILEKRNGGNESIDNGALLSRTSHILLHRIEHYNYDLYLEWQNLFKYFNYLKRPLELEEFQFIYELRCKTKDFFMSIKKPLQDQSTLRLSRELK